MTNIKVQVSDVICKMSPDAPVVIEKTVAGLTEEDIIEQNVIGAYEKPKKKKEEAVKD